MQLSEKQKTLSQTGLQKTWLDNSLKSPISENPSKSNMVNGTKHC